MSGIVYDAITDIIEIATNKGLDWDSEFVFTLRGVRETSLYASSYQEDAMWKILLSVINTTESNLLTSSDWLKIRRTYREWRYGEEEDG